MLNIQKKLTKGFYAILSLPSTAMGFGLSIQIAALSWILNTKYHLNIEQVGFVWAAGPIAGIVAQVLVGFISDKVWFWNGRRRPFILIGGTLAALMLLCLPNLGAIQSFFQIGSLMPVAVVVALTLDLSINVSFNPTRSIIADVTPEGNERTKGYTWMQTISGAFGVFAYLIGASFGNYFLIYFGAILVFLGSVIPTFFIEEPKNLEASQGKTSAATKTDWPALIKIYVAHGFSWIGVQTMFVFIFAYIQTKFYVKQTDVEVGQVIAIAFAILNTVGFILPKFVLEPLSEKITRVRTQALSVLSMAVGYGLILIFGRTAIGLYILMAVLGIGWSAIVSLPFAIMSEKVDQSKMGFFMGIFNLSVVLPQLLVSLVIGHFIKDAPDKNLIFIISTLSLAVSAILWLFVRENKED